MKRINNKGFAITTMLYGMLMVAFLTITVIMSTLASNRKNTANLVDKIEEELNRHSITQTEITGTDTAQLFIVPHKKAGWYKIELWGAGGYCPTTAANQDYCSKGAYTSGMIYLAENDYLYFYIGKQGTASSSTMFNGGGSGASGSGGGATDVRLVGAGSGYADADSLNSRIMVAAGGGGSNGTDAGGDGGTLLGIDSKSGTLGGQQVASTGSVSGVGGNCGSTGYGSGGGYFGGAKATTCGSSAFGSGGSSFIAGYGGSNSTAANKQSLAVNGKYFLNGKMIPGVNSGPGKATIELITPDPVANSDSPVPGAKNPAEPAKKNDNWPSSIRYIKDCITPTSANASNLAKWKEITVVDTNGNNVAAKRTSEGFTDGLLGTVTSSGYKGTANTEICVTIDLGSAKSNIAEIAVIHHNTTAGEIYTKETISAGTSTSSLTTLLSWDSGRGYKEGSEGIRVSKYDYGYINTATKSIPIDNYIIRSAIFDHVVLSNLISKDAFGNDTSQAYLDAYTGEKTQKWTIIKNEDNATYRIADNQSQLVLQPADAGQEENELVEADTLYTGNREQKWVITNVGNSGFYQFKSQGTNFCLTSADATDVQFVKKALRITTCNNTNRNQLFRIESV